MIWSLVIAMLVVLGFLAAAWWVDGRASPFEQPALEVVPKPKTRRIKHESHHVKAVKRSVRKTAVRKVGHE